MLLRNALGIDRATFHASPDRELSDEDAEALDRAVRRRIEGEPLSYITGHREFYGLDFVVTPDVLGASAGDGVPGRGGVGICAGLGVGMRMP